MYDPESGHNKMKRAHRMIEGSRMRNHRTPLEIGPVAVNRWASWAQLFADRHGVLRNQSSRVAMVLNQPGAFVHLIRERWLRSVNLHPTLNLSITNVLRDLSAQSLDRGTGSRGDSTSAPGRRNSSLRVVDGVPYYQLPPSFSYAGSSSNDRDAAAASVHVRSNTRADIPARAFEFGLGRALRRLNNPNFATLNSRVLEAQKERSVVAARVLARSSRMEVRPYDLVSFATRAPSLVFRRAIKETDPLDQWDSTSVRAHPTQSAPAMDVHSLTEEVIRRIDSKATAWRERMGKM